MAEKWTSSKSAFSFKREVNLLEKEKIAEKVEKIILPDVEALGMELVDVEYLQDGAYYFLRVYVEKLDKENQKLS